MKNIRKSQIFIQYDRKSSLGLLSERYHKHDVAKKNGESKISKNEFILTQRILISFLLIFGFLVCSAAYYVAYNNNNYKSEINIPQRTEEPDVTTTTTLVTTTSIFTTTTTIIVTLTTTILEKNLIDSRDSINITLSCGKEHVSPCETENGSFCNGTIIGDDNLCHPLECAPSIPSGKGGCGDWALNWCKDKK